MKKLLIGLCILGTLPTAAFSAKVKETKNVALDEWYSRSSRISLDRFKTNCAVKVEAVADKLQELELKYDELDSGDFATVMDISHFWYYSGKRRYLGYYCDAKLINKNAAFLFAKENSKMLKRLKKKEHKTACDKTIKENEDTKEILFQEKILGRSLIQGRLCYVYSVELLKNNKD